MPEDSTTTFEALADPTRREILRLLSDGELAATDIANAITWLGRTSVSSHLRVLRTAGLVNERRDGKFRYYSIDPAPATGVMEFLSAVYRSSLEELRVDAASPSAKANSRNSVSDAS